MARPAIELAPLSPTSGGSFLDSLMTGQAELKHSTNRLKIPWSLHLEFTIIVMLRVVKAELSRMQHHPGGRKPLGYTNGATAIEPVADDRMADRFKMRANLMRPAGLRHQQQARSHPIKRFLDPVGCR